MQIGVKVSVVFCMAAVFLLGVGIAAVFVVDNLNKILSETSYYNQQMQQVGAALRAVRVSPDRVTDHLARVNDLQKWARTDQERQLLAEARTGLQSHATAEATTRLERLDDYYCSATAAAHQELLTIHHRAVIGIIIVMINSVLLFVFLTWLVRHWLLNPVSDLGETMAVLAAGQFESQIKSSAGKEFDEIAASLNTIAGKLRDSEKRATAAEKFAIIGQACTHVTHNVRSLLNSIRSLAQHESNVAEAQHDSRVGFNYIIASVNKLDVWIRDLHSSVAPHNPNCVPLQVEPIIHDALSLLQPRLHERNLTIDYQTADELPVVIMDRAQFEQAFVAVVTNAIEASPDNGHIGVFLKNGNADRLTVQIQDEGAGMTEITRAHAFEAFFTTKPQSTGLGLTIAQAIIQRHGGAIEIESTAEKGTRVLIHLPSGTKKTGP